jgi:hypothetical protein
VQEPGCPLDRRCHGPNVVVESGAVQGSERIVHGGVHVAGKSVRCATQRIALAASLLS